MPIITAIKPTKRDPSRVAVHVDRKYVATLPVSRVHALSLTVGSAWQPELATAVDEAQQYDKAWRDASRHLARRMFSERMLRDKLRQREHQPATIDRVIDRLKELELLDDATFGRALIRETLNRKPTGPNLLLVKLRQKGIDSELANALLREITQPAGDDEDAAFTRHMDTDRHAQAVSVEGARALAERKLRSLQRVEPMVRKRRLYGMLARRGFGPDIIQDALHDLPGLDDDVDADAL